MRLRCATWPQGRVQLCEPTIDGTLICDISLETLVSEDLLEKHLTAIRTENPRIDIRIADARDPFVRMHQDDDIILNR